MQMVNTLDEIKEDEFHYSEDRDARVKDTAEVFTPPDLVNEMLDRLNIDWTNPPQDKTFLDPTCGSGNFLIELAKRGIPIKNIYGVDLMPDNIKTTKRRLKEFFISQIPDEVMTDEPLRRKAKKAINLHLKQNIVCADALTYHYQFWWYVDPEKRINDITGLPPGKTVKKPKKKKIEEKDPENSVNSIF